MFYIKFVHLAHCAALLLPVAISQRLLKVCYTAACSNFSDPLESMLHIFSLHLLRISWNAFSAYLLRLLLIRLSDKLDITVA